jgi:hypothetical protein
MFLRHAVSASDEHATIDAGFTLHNSGATALLQYSVPLHKLPSSSLAHAASVWHPHADSPGAHVPPLHPSPLVHVSPSLHVLPSGRATIAHRPVFLSHWLLPHAESPLLSHCTTVAGLTLHAYGVSALSQYGTPLQRSPSSGQSPFLVHGQTFLPGTHLPCSQ